jgi:hypothetical protein
VQPKEVTRKLGSYLKGVDALLVIIDDKKLSNQVMVFEFS